MKNVKALAHLAAQAAYQLRAEHVRVRPHQSLELAARARVLSKSKTAEVVLRRREKRHRFGHLVVARTCGKCGDAMAALHQAFEKHVKPARRGVAAQRQWRLDHDQDDSFWIHDSAAHTIDCKLGLAKRSR